LPTALGLRVTVMLLGILTLSIDRATVVFAALDANVFPAQGQPGDRITVTTDDSGNPGAYAGLVDQAKWVYLQPRNDSRYECGAPGQHQLGSLIWNGDVGSLVFRIPQVPAGPYKFRIQVDGGCWTMGARSGPLILAVIDAASHQPTTKTVQLNLLVAALLIAAVVIAIVAIAGLTRRYGLWPHQPRE
jgi:hypothetical protein